MSLRHHRETFTTVPAQTRVLRELFTITSVVMFVFSGEYFAGGETGMAVHGTACTAKSVGISVDVNAYEPHIIAGSMAHMIGHNVGMDHDDKSAYDNIARARIRLGYFWFFFLQGFFPIKKNTYPKRRTADHALNPNTHVKIVERLRFIHYCKSREFNHTAPLQSSLHSTLVVSFRNMTYGVFALLQPPQLHGLCTNQKKKQFNVKRKKK